MRRGILLSIRRIPMDAQTSPAALPELQAFLASFHVRFRRPEGREALERYTTGLLTELPNKNGDTIAQAVPGTSEQRLQEFLTKMSWDEEDLNRQRVQKMSAEAGRGEGVLVVDDTGFPKQGKASVGVARQYSGTLGKVGHCQIAVTCCDSDRQGTWPVAVWLYWAQALGGCPRAPAAGTRAGGRQLPDQARDCLGAAGSGPRVGRAPSRCRGRRG